MFNLKLPTMMALAALLIFAAAAITACGGDDPGAQPGLTDDQIREIVRDEVSTSATAQGGLTRADVEEQSMPRCRLPQPKRHQADRMPPSGPIAETEPLLYPRDVEAAVAPRWPPFPNRVAEAVERSLYDCHEGRPASETDSPRESGNCRGRGNDPPRPRLPITPSSS